jgi:hypothetical protein
MLTVASIVKNEADRFLARALDVWGQFADRIVVLDDGSTDETPEILRKAGVEAHFEPQGMFGAEWKARKRLYELATADSEWVLWLDADQIPSSDPRPHLIEPSVVFRVFDLWSEDTYRADAWWSGHTRCWWRAIHAPSYAGLADEWAERGWHSGHLPRNLPQTCHATPVGCSILHYAYSTPELRAKKAQMYRDLAPHLTPKEVFHASTIDKATPNTRALPFEPTWSLL